MNNSINRYNNNKATVCANKVCATVYGETARIVNTIVVAVVFVVGVTIIAKALK
jgi:hypothetical protein